MKLIFTFLISCIVVNVLTAQDPVVISRLNNTSVTEQDNVVVVSSLGESPAGVTEQDGIVVTNEPFPFIVMGEPTSIKNLPLIEGLKVYPNPTSILAVVERKQSEENYIVNLFSAAGTALLQQPWKSGDKTFEFSLQNFAPGLYILSVKDEKESKASQFRILKQ